MKLEIFDGHEAIRVEKFMRAEIITTPEGPCIFLIVDAPPRLIARIHLLPRELLAMNAAGLSPAHFTFPGRFVRSGTGGADPTLADELTEMEGRIGSVLGRLDGLINSRPE